MIDMGNPMILLIGVPALGVLLYLMGRHFSAKTRERRRRGESHRLVISRK